MGGQPDVKPSRAELRAIRAELLAINTTKPPDVRYRELVSSGMPLYQRTVRPFGGGGATDDASTRSPHPLPLKRPLGGQVAPAGEPNPVNVAVGGATRASAYIAENFCKRKRSCSSSIPDVSHGTDNNNESNPYFGRTTHDYKPFQHAAVSLPHGRSTRSPPLPHSPFGESGTAVQSGLELMGDEANLAQQSPPPPLPHPPPPVDSLLLDKTLPLGLKLNKTPSLLDFFTTRLEETGGGGGAGGAPLVAQQKQPTSGLEEKAPPAVATWQAAAGAGGAAEEDVRDKMKASNFGAQWLKIGSWEREAMHDGDLVAKCYYAKRKLVWEVLEGGLKSKIEVQWADISRLRTQLTPGLPGVLEIELSRAPVFFRETNPQPRKHTVWQGTTDFTFGEATNCRVHVLVFGEGVLNRPLEKLLFCDSRLKALHQQLPPHSHPYNHGPPLEPLGWSPHTTWSSPSKHAPTPLQPPQASPSRKLRKAATCQDADRWPVAGSKTWPGKTFPMHDLASPVSVMVDPRGSDTSSGSSDGDCLHERNPSTTPPPLWGIHHPQTHSPTKSSTSTLRSSHFQSPTKSPKPGKLLPNHAKSKPSPHFEIKKHEPHPIRDSNDVGYYPYPPPPPPHASGAHHHHELNSFSPADLSSLATTEEQHEYFTSRSPSPPPQCLDSRVSNVLGYSTHMLMNSSETHTHARQSQPLQYDDTPDPFLADFRHVAGGRSYSSHARVAANEGAKGVVAPSQASGRRSLWEPPCQNFADGSTDDSPPGSPVFGSLSPPVSPLSTPLREDDEDLLGPPASPLCGEDRVLLAPAGKLCSIPKVDSSGDLLLNLPRIASMPKFL